MADSNVMYWSTALGSFKMTLWSIKGKISPAFTVRIHHSSVDVFAGLTTITSRQAEIAHNTILHLVQNGFRDGKTSRKTIILSMTGMNDIALLGFRNSMYRKRLIGTQRWVWWGFSRLLALGYFHRIHNRYVVSLHKTLKLHKFELLRRTRCLWVRNNKK